MAPTRGVQSNANRTASKSQTSRKPNEDSRQQESVVDGNSPFKSVHSPLKRLQSSQTTPTKKRQAKSSRTDSPEVKPGGTILNFFNNAALQNQRKRTIQPIEEEFDGEDLIDSIDDISSRNFQPNVITTNGSRTLQAARKRKQNDASIGETCPSLSGSFTGSQKFRKTSSDTRVFTGSKKNHDDIRPWTEKYGPINLEELAVHKKKVSDVKAVLEDSLSSRARPRVIVLKGPVGSGKTMTVKLLADALNVDVKDWTNPSGHDGGFDGSISSSTRFEDFLFRSGKYAGLELVSTNISEQTITKTGSDEQVVDSSSRKPFVMLVEEFPASIVRGSTALEAFRASIYAYLSQPMNSKHQAAPLVIIISESLLSSASTNESMTPHRLLGPTILTHPLTAVIEFNPIAPTLLTKALSLITTKESRISGRRRIPGPAVLSQIAEMGDIRSAVSALEFLCLRGDGDDKSWSSKVNFSKPKGKSSSKRDGDDGMTDQEKEALKLVTGREGTLGLWHSVGKVVYNKRKDAIPPQEQSMNYKHGKIPENDPEQLLLELGTDISTFISAIHENFVLSCSSSSTELTIQCLEDCFDALSTVDCQNIDRFQPGQSQGTALEIMKQEEMIFHTAVRSIVFHLPFPVKREQSAGQSSSNRSRGNVMIWPHSLRLWKEIEEIQDILGICMEEYGKAVQKQHHASGIDSSSGEIEGYRPVESLISKQAMLLHQAPYMKIIQDAKKTSSALRDRLVEVVGLKTLHVSNPSTGRFVTGDDIDEENDMDDTRRKHKKNDGYGLSFGVADDVMGLTLSDDEIVDDG